MPHGDCRAHRWTWAGIDHRLLPAHHRGMAAARSNQLSFPRDRQPGRPAWALAGRERPPGSDRKSTRLNSSHLVISYAVFCLKKKNTLGDILCTITELSMLSD